MKRYLPLSVAAAFAVTPALANEPNTQPGMTAPGANSQDGKNVIDGTKGSTEGGKVVESGDKNSPAQTSPAGNRADNKNVIDGAKESTEGRAAAPMADGEKTKPGLTAPGSNPADGENRLPPK